MKKKLWRGAALAALLCALLAGCGQAAPTREVRLPPSTETENDNLRCYPLDAADCRFLTFGKDLLVLRPTEDGAELLRCRGRALTVAFRAEVAPGAEIFTGGEKIGCFDPKGQMLSVFSAALTLEGTYSLPDCASTPVMNRDRVYYADAKALMELDMETGIHRTLREQEGLTPTALLEGEGLLICGGQYIQLEDGALLTDSPQVIGAEGSRLCVRCGHWDCLYLGKTMLPLPTDWSFLAFLPGRNAALVSQSGKTLAVYDLSTGNRLAQAGLPGKAEKAVATEDGRVFFTANGMLYQWEPEWESTRDSRITVLQTRENPDGKELAQCRQRGSYLENQYGVQVLYNTDGVRAAPKGVILEPEHVSAPVLETLAGIEKALSPFPKELVKAAFDRGGRFYLCPVRSIRGEAGEEYGIQFWSGRDCYVVVAASDQVPKTMTRLLSGLLERRLLMDSDALDRWGSLNPPGFVYGQSQWEQDAFVNSAGAQTPSADRAELLWAALESGNRELFLSAQLQNKLRCLCQGLRQLLPQGTQGTLPWEQYLWRQI